MFRYHVAKMRFSLKYKAWAIVAIIVALCTLIAIIGLRYLVLDSFLELENERVHSEEIRAANIIQQNLTRLGEVVKTFAHDQNTSDLLRETASFSLTQLFNRQDLERMEVSEALLLGSDGHPIEAMTRETLVTGQVTNERTAQIAELLAPMFKSEDLQHAISTLYAHNGILELIAAAKIYDPKQREGYKPHVLVMSRKFSEQDRLDMAAVMMAPVTVSFDSTTKTSGTHQGEQGVPESPVQNLDSERSDDELQVVLHDYQKRPIGDLMIKANRHYEDQRQKLFILLLTAALFSALLASAILICLLNKVILSRIQGVQDDLKFIMQAGVTGASQIRLSGNDEITELSQSINSLLTRVQEDAVLQKQIYKDQEALRAKLAQNEKMQAIGRFSSGIAHDINNSMAAIVGWIKIAKEDLDPEHVSQEALDYAMKSVRYTDGLMRQLRTYSHQSPASLERVRARSIIQDAYVVVSAGLIRNCTLRLSAPLQDDWIEADATQIQQVLVNLLINASDAMNGQGVIHLDQSNYSVHAGLPDVDRPETIGLPAGEYLCLAVKDEGPGIPNNIRDKIFEPFFTTKSSGRGTGLGLAVAYGVLSRHSGAIGAYNLPRKGACFCVYLPIAAAVIGPLTQPASLEEAPRERRILFVEDDELVRHAWCRVLERMGWQVSSARNGQEAWQIYQQASHSWNIILTDRHMPEVNGIELFEMLRRTENPPPVVLMSGNINYNEEHQLLKMGFAALLHKPVEALELQQVLREIAAR